MRKIIAVIFIINTIHFAPVYYFCINFYYNLKLSYFSPRKYNDIIHFFQSNEANYLAILLNFEPVSRYFLFYLFFVTVNGNDFSVFLLLPL